MNKIFLIFIYFFKSYCCAQNWPPTTKTESSVNNITLIECLTTSINSFKAKQLISKGCDLKVKGPEGESLLELAVKANLKDVIEILLLKKADVNSINNSGQTPLMIAAELANLNLINMLLESGADMSVQDNKNKDALTYALKRPSPIKLEIIKIFINHGFDLQKFSSPQGDSFLSYACRMNDIDLVKFLVEEGGFDIDEVDSAGLDLIERNSFNSFELLKYLIEKRANKKLLVYYFKIVNIGNVNLLDYFLSCYKVDINALNSYGESAIMNLECSIPVLMKLIEKGIDVNTKSVNGKTAIMFASYDLNLEKVMLLYYNGAKIDQTDKNNWTTLDFAERSHISNSNGRKESLILFLKNSCNARNGINLMETELLRN